MRNLLTQLQQVGPEFGIKLTMSIVVVFALGFLLVLIWMKIQELDKGKEISK